MSKELENVKNSIMDKIHNRKIKMKPKIYFIFGSAIAFAGLIASMITSVFLVGLIRFSLRSHGPMGQYRLDTIISNFPWWTTVLAITFLIVGVLLMRKYDFSHKIKPIHLIIGLILAVFIAGWLIDLTGINDTLFHHGPMQGMMRGYIRNNNI